MFIYHIYICQITSWTGITSEPGIKEIQHMSGISKPVPSLKFIVI